MMYVSGMLLAGVSTLAGWVGLYPLRRHLGPSGYHLAAYPIGLLLWPLAVATGSVLRAGFNPLPYYAVLVALLFCASLWLRRTLEDSAVVAVPAWSYLAWGAAVVGLAGVVDATGYTSALYDSVFHFERWGTWLTVTGSLHREIVESYGVFIPSVHAVNRYFGGDWASTPYPVLSLHVAAVFAVAVRSWTKARVGRVASWVVTVLSVVLLVATPRYLHHSLYVHGHMFTAAYLMLAVYATQRAYFADDGSSRPLTAPNRGAWLLVAGLAAGGVALTRADGIAYVLVPALTATLVWWEGRHPKRDQALYVAALAAPVALVYGSAFLRLRFWRGGKLSGKRAAAVLGVLAATAGATLLLDHLGPVTSWLRRGRNALWLIAGGEVAVLAALFALRPEDSLLSSRNMITNLLFEGGNGHLWFFLIGAVIVSLLYRGQWRDSAWPTYLLFAIGQFFFIAVVVHSLSHVGRLSPNDSFNRTSFHAVPLILWYATTVVTAAIADYTGSRDGA